ncbi:MAG: penicillin-binding protein [Saprospiraceae bacterium]
MKDEIIIRTYVVFLLFVLTGFLILGRVIQVGVIEGDRWRARGDSLYVKHQPIEAERGNIMSSDGRLLVTSLPLFDVRMDLLTPSKERFLNNIDSLALCLSRYVNPSISERAYRDLLWRERQAGNRYLMIKNDVSYSQMEKIKNFPLFRLGQSKSGLILVKRARRERPYRMLASRTLGSVRTGANPVGLEGYYDKVLGGEQGSQLVQKVARDIWVPVDDISEYEPKRGQDIVTHLDIDIQDVAEQALYKSIAHHNALGGTAVVMEVKTGAIKAMANLSRSGDDIGEYFNYAVAEATEPGSTFKLATMMALYEDGLISPIDRVNINQGSVEICGKKIKDSEDHGIANPTLRQVFAMSSNVGVAVTAQKYYANNAKKFINRLHQFRLDKRSGIDLEGEPTPYIKQAYNQDQKWSCTSIPWMAHGYELTLTPLQMLTFYNAVANKGKMMQPQLVHQVLEYSEPIKTIQPEVLEDKICSKATLNFALDLLKSTVDSGGTARALKNDLYSIAGKTGTAVTNYFKGDISEGKKYQASFTGFFPAEDPTYSCIVVIYEPKVNGFYGASAAMPVFKEIADYCIASQFILPSEMADEEKPMTTNPNIRAGGYATDLRTILHFSGVRFENNCISEWGIVQPDENRLELSGTNADSGQIPDVRGMGLRDALFILENKGIRVKLLGHGRVKRQSIAPGTKVEGQTIELTMG